MKLTTYDKYKDSGVEWLGEVPELWKVRRAKDIADITRGAILRPVDEPAYFDENGEWYYLNISDTTKCEKYLSEAKLRLSKLGSTKSARVLPNNLILTASATIGKPIINKVKVCVHDGFIPFKKIKSDINYLFYYVQNKNIYKAMGKSNTQKNIYLDEVKNMPVLYPILETQTLIANYLDQATTQIDQKINLLTKKIKHYQDLKTAIINKAVTKGLDDTVKMKDSGVEWIGEIPEHWEVTQIKRVTVQIQTGKTPPTSIKKYFEGELLNWFTPSDFTKNDLTNSKRKISINAIEDKVCNLYPKNTILLVGIGATLGKVGIIKQDSSTNQQINTLVFQKTINPYYALFFMKRFESYIKSCSYASTLAILNQNETKYLIILKPSLIEQNNIVGYLNKKTNTIDQIIITIQTQIEKQKELRKTLINDVVTGKIKVEA